MLGDAHERGKISGRKAATLPGVKKEKSLRGTQLDAGDVLFLAEFSTTPR
jgi:hypothetical protein